MVMMENMMNMTKNMQKRMSLGIILLFEHSRCIAAIAHGCFDCLCKLGEGATMMMMMMTKNMMNTMKNMCKRMSRGVIIVIIFIVTPSANL